VKRAALYALSLLMCLAPRSQADEDDDTCQRSYVEGQKLYKLQHDLLHGRAELLVCAKTCPDQLRESCGRWLKEIEAELPSIVVKAKNGYGRDVSDVKIDVDDHPIAYVDGLPIELNAGDHVIRVHTLDGRAVEQSVLVSAGEKLKVVEVWTEPRVVDVVRVRRPVSLGTFVLLGVGGVALASFATFAIWTSVEFASTNACASSGCSPTNHDSSFDAKAAIADVSLGVSVAAFAAALIVFATRPKITEHVQRATFVAPWLVSGSGGLSVGRYF
jgi:hypothetical protein